MFSTKPPALLALFACACAGAPPLTRQAELDRAFERIQVEEASIERHHARLADARSPRPDKREAARAVCAAQADICGIAAEVADADAFTRCEHARRRCATSRAEARAACGCEKARR